MLRPLVEIKWGFMNQMRPRLLRGMNEGRIED